MYTFSRLGSNFTKMNKLIFFFITLYLCTGFGLHAADQNRSLLEKLLNKDLPGGAGYGVKDKNKSPQTNKSQKSKESVNQIKSECEKRNNRSLLEKALRKDLPGGDAQYKKCIKTSQLKKEKIEESVVLNKRTSNNNISVYTGTFDVIDKEGDDQSTLFGVEHKNTNLFRNTFLGKFSPIPGAFMTGNSSIYLYTGIEGQYGIGPLKILPSFAPGYYEKGDGKDLGSVLEFKSEIKLDLDIFEKSAIGYSYSHISNNNWGDRNPGTDNQQITFSRNF